VANGHTKFIGKRGGNGLALGAPALARDKFGNIDGDLHIAARLPDDFAHFARHERGQFLLAPFQDDGGAQDDFAGFVLRDGVATGEIAVVHLTWSGAPEQPGWPSYHVYTDFWDWVHGVLLPDTAYAANEDDLVDL